MKIYLGLGANVGNAVLQLEHARDLLSQELQAVACAPLYITRPYGCEDQANFLNSALCGETTLSPEELRAFVKELERQLGRVPRPHHGPREIDIDILLYGEQVLQNTELCIPHAGLIDRDFVLQPLLDLDSTLVHPQTGVLLSTYLEAIPASERYILYQGDSTW